MSNIIVSKTPEYSSWKHMVSRCCNPRDDNFKNYGGRGISVCDKWKTFQGFLEDMGPRPGLNYSIERKDNCGNYCAANCKWATKSEQNSNTRRPRGVVFVFGEEGNIPDLLSVFGVKKSTFYTRLKRGWNMERALMGGNHGT